MKVPPKPLSLILVLLLVVELVSVLLLTIHLSRIDDDKARSDVVIISMHRMRNAVPTSHDRIEEQSKSNPEKPATTYLKKNVSNVSIDTATESHQTTGRKIQQPTPPTKNASVSAIYFLPVEKGISIRNSWSQTRYICGQSIPSNGTVVINFEDCPKDVAYGRVFPKEPTLSGEGMGTMVVRFQDDHKKHKLENVTCDIPCSVWPSGNPTTRNPATIDGTPFRFVAYSMEGSGIYKSLQLKPLDHYHHRYYATTSFQSDVPLSYYAEKLWNIQYPPPAFNRTIKGASFLAKNCNSYSNRENLFNELKKYASTSTPSFRVESLSSCLRNALPPNGVHLDNKTEVMRSYLFHFAFENQLTDDYITEKLWGALASGTVPVYFGAPNVLDHVPSRSIIHVHDYSSPQELITHLTTLAYNETLYSSYHDWRRRPLPRSFHEKYDFTKVHSHCRVCRLSYALKYGWGWDHKRQQVLPLRHSRETCLDEKAWMVHPIREIWNPTLLMDAVGNDNNLIKEDGSVDCRIKRKRHIPIPKTHWVRTVWDHDGVTDIEISIVEGYTIDPMKQVESMLRLQTPVNTSQLIHRGVEGTITWQQVYWIQDGDSRVVFVFNETTNLSDVLKVSGSVDIIIKRPLKIRLIVEDVDTFHEGGAEKESYFGSLMTDEFLHPLEWVQSSVERGEEND